MKPILSVSLMSLILSLTAYTLKTLLMPSLVMLGLTVISPDLCIVDGTEFIITNGPFGPGEIIKPMKVVAGTDRVAIDSYCSTLLGYTGEDILQIKKASALGLGEIDLNKAKIKEINV